MAAGYNIDQLKSQIGSTGGFAMANQFMVTLPQLTSYRADANELNLMCSAAALPGRQVLSQDYQIGTVNRKIANGFAVTDMTLTFLVTNSHGVREYFEAWQKEAHNPETKEVGYFKDYTYPVKIQTLEKGQRLSLFKKQLGFANKIPTFLKNRLPNLGPIDLGQGEIDLGASFDAKATYTVNLLECYPTSLNEQQLGNANEGIMEFSVQLSFTDWESEGGEYSSDRELTTRSILSNVLGLLR
jgi:hypothetical protein